MSWCLFDCIPFDIVSSIILEYCEFEAHVLLCLTLPGYNTSYWKQYWKRRRPLKYETNEDINQDIIMSLLCDEFKPSSRWKFTPLDLPDLQYLVYHCTHNLPITYETCICLVTYQRFRSSRYYLSHLTLGSAQYFKLVMEIGLGSRQYFQEYLDINAVLYDYSANICASVDELNADYSYHTVWLRVLQQAPNIAMKYVFTPGLRLDTWSRSPFDMLWHSLNRLGLTSDPVELRIARLYTDAIKTIITLDPASMKEWNGVLENLTYNSQRFIDMIES